MDKERLRIKEILKEKGITQASLADKLGILPISLSQSLNRCNFTLDRLDDIAHALGVDITDLFVNDQPSIIECPHCHKRFKIVPID